MALILKSKKQAEMLKEQNKSGGVNYFKPNYNPETGFAFVFICPPKNEDTTIITKVAMHEAFGGKQKLTDGLVASSNFGETSDITKLGFDLKKKYAESNNKSLKAMHSYFIPKDKNIIFVIDPKDEKKGIQQWQAPYAVASFLLSQIEGDGEGSESGDMSFAHPTTGKLLKIKRKGEGMKTEYTVEWAKKKPDFKEITEDKLVEMLALVPNVIGGIFKKPSKESVQKYKDFLTKYAEEKGVSLNWENTKKSNLKDSSEEDEDSSTDVDGADDEELNLDDKKKSTKSKKSNQDDEEEDVEVDLNDEEDED